MMMMKIIIILSDRYCVVALLMHNAHSFGSFGSKWILLS